MTSSPVNAINVIAYLSPDPLDHDTPVESEFLEWLPGFDNSECKNDDDEMPIYREHNIAIYERIEQYCADQFKKGLENLAPLLKDYLFHHIQISIDLIQNVFASKYALASYHHGFSKPAKGKYVFQLHHTLFCKYMCEMENKYVPDLRDKFVWEHEIIHLLDHYEIAKTALLLRSTSIEEKGKAYKLKYREEGLADLFLLLNGEFNEYTSIEKARKTFILKCRNAYDTMNDADNTEAYAVQELFAGLGFYEIGPWLILDLLREIGNGYYEKKINSILTCLYNGKKIEKNTILEIIELALSVSAEEFLAYADKLDTEIYNPLKPVKSVTFRDKT